MKALAEGFYNPTPENHALMSEKLKTLTLGEVEKEILEKHSIEIESDVFKTNLEAFLGTLYSLKFYFDQVNKEVESAEILKVINNTKGYILY